ncbi:MAG: hypothetical protein AAGD10_21780 [Myxococcota bacterium]
MRVLNSWSRIWPQRPGLPRGSGYVAEGPLRTIRFDRRIVNAPPLFNFANSGAPAVADRAEDVLMLSAFEQFVGTSGRSKKGHSDKKKLVRRRVRADSLRTQEDEKETIRGWMESLFELRSNLAHGNAVPAGRGWTAPGHLLDGASAFSILLKARLVRDGDYKLDSFDRAQAAAFGEQL